MRPTNHWLLVQVEKETNPESVIFAFNTVDHEMVMHHLPRISSYIRQCVMDSDYSAIFANDGYSTMIGAKAIPIKRGQYQVSLRSILVEIQERTSLVLSKMIRKPEKRSCLSSVPGTMFSTIASIPSSAPKVQLTSITTKPHSTPISSLPSYTSQLTEARIQAVETRLDSSTVRKDNLENLCIQLKGNTDIISHQLQQLTSHLMTTRPSSPCCSPVTKSIRLSTGS